MHLPGPRNSPVYSQSLPEHCLRLKKIKKKVFFLKKGPFKKYTIYGACSLQKNPLRGASPKQKKKKREREKTKKKKKVKKKTEKRKENRERSKDKKRTKE